jgi:hypothetical protein
MLHGEAFYLAVMNDEVSEELNRAGVINSFIQPIGPEVRLGAL